MSFSALDEVSTTTGMLFHSAWPLISASTSRPSMRGRFRSSRMMSGSRTPLVPPAPRNASIASSPSLASRTSSATLLSASTSRVSRASAGLSSTNRTWIGNIVLHFLRLRRKCVRKRKQKRRTLTLLRLQPDLSSLPLHNLLADGKTDSVPRIVLSALQSLKHLKNPLEMPRFDADPVVAHAKDPLAAAALGRYLNDRRSIRPPELDRIADQILEQARHLRVVAPDFRQLGDLDLRSALFDRHPQLPQHATHDVAHLPQAGILGARPHAGVCQQVFNQVLHPPRPIHGEGDKLVGVRVELAFVALRQQLRITGDHAQWFLQIVRGHIGELLQLGVRALQVLFGLLCLRQVARQLGEALWSSTAIVQRREHHPPPETRPVLAVTPVFDDGFPIALGLF